ncbi:MAG: divalent metal cation transporter [Chitinophagaceae bacterium]|nr:divalent metal cation transporter [Chitinophagaceae bacterium]
MHCKKSISILKPSKSSGLGGALMGAAFLMATSAIGPGFLTQTAKFTEELVASFGFIILVSVLLDIGVQLNIWRIITVSRQRAQDLANNLLPGLGYFLAALIALGGIVFNVGNIAGCGLGLEVLTGMSAQTGAIISCVFALVIFWYKDAGNMVDLITKLLGLLMIALTVYIAFVSKPPMAEAMHKIFIPDKIDVMKIVTLVGGTVGGYISFAGAHRLLDAGISGSAAIKDVTKSAVSGILVTSIMRFILFLAALGVVWHGVKLGSQNPAGEVFRAAAGKAGYMFFGIVLWCAAITSVIGASYTSISFWKTFHPAIAKNEKIIISLFIISSTSIFMKSPNPVKLLIFAGAFNGIILPLALAVILIVAAKPGLLNGYKHPLWMQVTGWLVVAVMTWMSWLTIRHNIGELL